MMQGGGSMRHAEEGIREKDGKASWKSRLLCLILWSALLIVFMLLLDLLVLVSLGLGASDQPTALIRWRVNHGIRAQAVAAEEAAAAPATAVASNKLAVVVPTHAGDIQETVRSLEKWPTTCSQNTLDNVDLVVFKAEGYEEEIVTTLLPRFRTTAGRCFADTRIVFANLTKEQNEYPTGPSEQFFQMFLDEGVKAALARYDVLGVIEHDVTVAHEDSFSQLYQSAFYGSQGYWVKGSVLAGKNFHETATISGFWNVLGHINGNALYNNTDPAFTEFVEYTKMRWGYKVRGEPGKPPVIKYRFPYDVALWATIADFPYSWPLWQRFAERFVNSHLIANVGFIDVDRSAISEAVTRDTLFVHGSTTAGGSQKFGGVVAANRAEARAGLGERLKSSSRDDGERAACTAACGSSAGSLLLERPENRPEPGTSRVCDPTCIPGGEQGVRFGGYLCGGGNSSVYGESCRTCYTDINRAREAERQLRLGETSMAGSEGGSKSEEGGMYAAEEGGRHVIMCDTLRPPSSPDCSKKCHVKTDTVCDHTCGTGRFDNYNCNWRGHGPTCRYCFNDVEQALKADVIARQFGGRVIMCDTHNPPRQLRVPAQGGAGSAGNGEIASAVAQEEGKQKAEEEAAAILENAKIVGPSEEEESKIITPFVEGMVRADMCAFIPGYFRFIAETEVAVLSVVTFMRGMRVVVSAHPSDFPVFQKTLGDLPNVSVVEVADVGTSALLADKHCGDGVRLIYYLNAGEILSREINFKDTHSPKGDLLVVYNDKVQSTAAILGFSSPTFGPDIMLPPEINVQLRQVVLKGHGSKKRTRTEDEKENDDYLARLLGRFSHIPVPQMLAALAYARNPPGMWFFNPSQWVDHHMFKSASIWDIPLVKPRFSCMVDMSLASLGYDVGSALRQTLSHFQAGTTCETGFIDLDRKDLQPDRNVEFGEAQARQVPPMSEFRVSVVYSLSEVDAGGGGAAVMATFEASLASVVEHFPDALEVVLVTAAQDRHLFAGVVAKFAKRAPYPVRLVVDEAAAAAVVASPVRRGGGGEEAAAAVARDKSRRRLMADAFCEGDFILHLDPNQVLIREVTYDVVFHFRKPVVPYARHPDGEWPHIVECRESETALLFGEPLDKRFSIFGTSVYPRKIYAEARNFIVQSHGGDRSISLSDDHSRYPTFEEIMADTGKSWAVPGRPEEGAWSSCTLSDREQVLPDDEFLEAFLWTKMHDEVFWLATDPRDIRRDDWAIDQFHFSWTCKALHPPVAEAGGDGDGGDEGSTELVQQYMADLDSVDSPFACWRFNNRWASN